MADTATLWVTALFGGLAGAVLNQAAQWAREWWNAPMLCVEFNQEIDGCVVDQVPYVHRDDHKTRTRKYLRLRVSNRGRTTAKDVQVIITKLSANTSPRWAFESEVMDAYWSGADESIRLDIPSRTPRFADICWAEHTSERSYIALCAAGQWNSALEKVDIKGIITVEASVVASNAATVAKSFRFRSDGTALGLEIVD